MVNVLGSAVYVPRIPRVVSSLPRRTAALQALVPGRGSKRILRIRDLHAHLSRPGGAGGTDANKHTSVHTHSCTRLFSRTSPALRHGQAASRHRRSATADTQPDLEHVEGLTDDHPDAARHYARSGRAELFAMVPLKILRRRAPPLRRCQRAPRRRCGLPSPAPFLGALAQAKRHSRRAPPQQI
jgi:hypothetical protein